MGIIYTILIAAFFLFDVAYAQLADSPWPVFHGDIRHTGLSPYNTSHVDGTVLWTFETGAGIESSPTIDKHGTVYIGSHDGRLYAIYPNGTLKWYFDTGKISYIEKWDTKKSIMSTPTIDSSGNIYVHSAADYLFAVNSDGKEKWRFPLKWDSDFWPSPAIGTDGTIYMGSARTEETNSMGLFAINPDGTEKWRFIIKSGVSSSPAIGNDGTIYVGGSDPETNKGKIYAINPDGTERWEFTTEDWEESSPTVGNNAIYIGSKEGKVYAINFDGTKKWSFQTGGGVSTVPAIGKDGTIYVGSWDYYFYAINADGTLKWRFLTEAAYEGVSSSAAIGADGIIYFGSNNGKFYALYPNGTEKWHYDTKSSIPGSPAIGKDGTIYIGTWDNKLYAFGKDKEKNKVEDRIINQTTEPKEEKESEPEKIEENKPISEKTLNATAQEKEKSEIKIDGNKNENKIDKYIFGAIVIIAIVIVAIILKLKR